MRQILIIEDEVLVAMELETALRRAGLHVVGPFVKVRDALRAIAEQTPDLAIIDINLNGENSQRVAEALLAARIPFITLTGYSEQEIPSIYRSSEVVTKPYDMSTLLEVIGQLDRPYIGYRL